jgi:hypothetical protein
MDSKFREIGWNSSTANASGQKKTPPGSGVIGVILRSLQQVWVHLSRIASGWVLLGSLINTRASREALSNKRTFFSGFHEIIKNPIKNAKNDRKKWAKKSQGLEFPTLG